MKTAGANRLVSNPATVSYTRVGGDRVYYNFATNEFAITGPGFFRTYMAPVGRADYFVYNFLKDFTAMLGFGK